MQVILLIGTHFAHTAAFRLAPRGCYICLRYEKSDDNDSPHKGYINDREKKMQLLLLFQVFSIFCLQLWSTCKSAPRKSRIFFITLLLIKYKCNFVFVQHTQPKPGASSSYLPDRFYNITPLSQDNFSSLHPVSFHIFEKAQGCIPRCSINLKHK